MTEIPLNPRLHGDDKSPCQERLWQDRMIVLEGQTFPSRPGTTGNTDGYNITSMEGWARLSRPSYFKIKRQWSQPLMEKPNCAGIMNHNIYVQYILHIIIPIQIGQNPMQFLKKVKCKSFYQRDGEQDHRQGSAYVEVKVNINMLQRIKLNSGVTVCVCVCCASVGKGPWRCERCAAK